MMLILSRHGNTFDPGDAVVWTGSQNDLPLVEKGLQQAEELAAALKQQGVALSGIYCGSLQRTRRYAEIVAQRLGLPVADITVDARLMELDYGDWTGLTHAEVSARFGQEALDAWDSKSQWPVCGNWGGSPEQTLAELQGFIRDVSTRHSEAVGPVLVVTSNGRLRYFAAAVPGEFDRRVADGTLKVKTGHVCGLSVVAGVAEKVLYWNQKPGIAL